MRIAYVGRFVPLRRFSLGAANSVTRFMFCRDDGRFNDHVDVTLPSLPPEPFRHPTAVHDEDGNVLVDAEQLWKGRPRLIISQAQLLCWTIFASPRDFPGKYVLRRFGVVSGSPVPVPEAEPIAVVDTLEEARSFVPEGLHLFTRAIDDEPQIVETWM